ncbi:MAG TPA: hypothetical protein VG605_03260 [Puia sp.]|jgi:hypothetical protein|nr:hypothetical protein [Puia sp.]HWB90838.1 hypothetical protein [Puia sp.]
MKKILSFRFAYIVFLVVVLPACRKKKIDPPPDDSFPCKIQWIAALSEGANDPGLYPDTLRFSYDSHGNLAAISRIRSTDLIYPNYTFWYDNQHRVTDVIGTGSLPVTSGNSFQSWHKLYYTNGKVTLDSLFIYGRIDGRRPNGFNGAGPNLTFVSTYEYDSLGRIKQATDLNPATYTQTQYFTYGGTGNLTRITQVSGYISNPTEDTVVGIFPLGDAYVNPNLGYPIFQFLNRNYSLNNQFIATAYNEEGLPTIIPQQGQPYLGHLKQYTEFGFLELIDPLTIQYNCELSGPEGGHGY